MFWMETAISDENIFSERGEEMIIWRVYFDFKSLFWLCLSTSDTVPGHRWAGHSSLCFSRWLQSCSAGSDCSSSSLSSSLLLLQGREIHLLKHIWWRKVLWIGPGSQSDSVLLLWVVSCTKQYSGHSVEMGEVRFFFFFFFHWTCYLLQSACYLYLWSLVFVICLLSHSSSFASWHRTLHSNLGSNLLLIQKVDRL